MLKYLHNIILLFLFCIQSAFAQSNEYNCFSILVGKDASVDGSVLFAHNEDDYGKNLVNWYKVPRLQHNNDKISLFPGGELDQIQETNEFIWLEMPSMHFSDSFINEYGVTIASDACPSKEDSAELVDGGIGYYLRRIIAERAISAKQGVKIAGAIIDSIGYASSGRTYCIADPNEAWMMSVVKGKHWVAQRIPDDHIAIIPNYYTIQQIDLTDTLNFLGSTDIIEYAIERGWYDPELNGEFNFREVYSNPSSLKSMGNIARHWGAINLLAAVHYELSDNFPFSFKPKEKVSIQDLMDVLKYHYEGTELEDLGIKSPHDYKAIPICRKDTQYGMIVQLRSWLPNEVGNILWIAPYRPCAQVFIPWYYGISEIPPNFAVGDYKSALENHFNKYDSEVSQTHNFWKFVEFTDSIDANYYELMPSLINKKESEQKKVFKIFNEFDSNINKTYKNNKHRAVKNMDYFMKDLIQISLDYLK